MELDKEQIEEFKKLKLPTFRPLKKHPNSISGKLSKLMEIKKKGGLIFKRNKKTYFFKADEIDFSSPKYVSPPTEPWEAAYWIPKEYRE